MKTPTRTLLLSIPTLMLASVVHAGVPAPDGAKSADKRSVVKPRKLSAKVHKGLGWLVEHQLKNGGWGQGEESRQMGGGQTGQANVADTSIATLALLRAGSTAKSGKHKRPINRAINYLLSEIEASDDKSLFVTKVRGTRVQSKLGPYIDTFLSAQVLAEVKDSMPDDKRELRVLAALDKVLTKIRRNQRSDGSFGGKGWAPVLSQAVAGKAVNRAAQSGVNVDDDLRERLTDYAEKQYNESTGDFGGEGSAGVGLYSAAASVGTLRDSVNSNKLEEKELEDKARTAKRPEDRKKAGKKLERYRATKAKQARAEGSIVRKLEDPRFASGFGSNGGEEFLSYMLISESLVAEGGKKWQKWNKLMTRNLGRVQNGDGSWTGHHCITGRTFVTAAALLVLTADRAPVPLASKISRG